MKLLKPSWVSHNGKPIFSVDIHPDGTKFATGGQGEDSGKVVIWNMAPVLREEDEKNVNIPKMLCQMDNHLACVNCVRWSNTGLYLASGGDDKLVMVWKRAAFIGPSTVFGSSSKLANVEQWRCVTILRNHTGDVMDVAWSPHDVWLASCSVDNTIVIWNARKFPEIVASLKGHTGLVKGLTWDPVGKYIASQADDHSLKVWRTMDWQQETNITKPFNECGGTTHVLRLSWSPDGQYLVSAHAMNNSGPTAQIIERDGWKTNMDFVGHRKAVTVVKFNPKIFKKKQRNGSSPKPSCPYCCCAVGSKDRSLSVWLTSLKRPLVVIHDLFDKSIMDISWTLNGLGILVCSMDGTVAYLNFSQDELGDPLNEDEKNAIHQNIYGKSLAITTEAQLSTTIIENPEMLKYQQERQRAEQANHRMTHEAQAHKLTSVVNGESLEDIRKNLLKKQVETRTADGRRRITPLCLSSLLCHSLLSISLSLCSASTPTPYRPVNLVFCSPSTLLLPTPPPPYRPVNLVFCPPPLSIPDSVSGATAQASSLNTTAMKSNLLLTTSTKMEPMKALDSRFTERSKVMPGVTISMAGLTPLDSLTCVWSHLSILQAMLEFSLPIIMWGLLTRDIYAFSFLFSPTAHLQATPSSEKEPCCVVAIPVAVLKLPTPTPQKAFTLQVSTEPPVYLEVENDVSAVSGAKLSQLRCSREGREWDTLLPSRVITAAGSSDVVAVACEDRMLSVFSACGRRLLPAILLPAPMSALHCSGFYVMALTACATLSVWDVQKQSAVVKNESLQTILSGTECTVSQSLLTQQGVPVIGLSNGKSYCFNSSLETWNLIADKQDSLVQCADFKNCISSQDAPVSQGPLALTQGHNLNAGRLASRLSSTPHHLQHGMTLVFLENQLASALTLRSSTEYHYWLLIYARFLVTEGSDYRLRELCKDLLGPVHKSAGSAWEPTTLGLRKRDLLRELLPVIGQNLRFQRLFTEYQDQLELLGNK
uniref:Protein HIRA n=1 Tax=Oncorhynchus tshawytscha TaxID=74940 RepID=A0A8C8EN77_ONCTS